MHVVYLHSEKYINENERNREVREEQTYVSRIQSYRMALP
jgi:hypothetical protein